MTRPARQAVLEELHADGVLVLTLNRPHARNAFDRQMWTDGRDALRDAMSDEAVRCVVVTGAAGAFTAGQDIKEMATIDTSDAASENGFSSFMDVLCEFDKPLVAAVNGSSAGRQPHLSGVIRVPASGSRPGSARKSGREAESRLSTMENIYASAVPSGASEDRAESVPGAVRGVLRPPSIFHKPASTRISSTSSPGARLRNMPASDPPCPTLGIVL